jgi:hypothetical protein
VLHRAPDPLLPVLFDVLRDRGRVTLVLAEDLAGHCGITNLEDGIVYLESSNTFGEMRATLGHELHHLLDPDCPEHKVEEATAELLVPLNAALAAEAEGDIASAAEQLAVDPQLVRARLRAAEQRPAEPAV